jgi:hypothetical protein
VFRGKFCAGLQALYTAGQLHFHGQLETLAQPARFQRLVRQATRHAWNVYAKRPFAGPGPVLKYLSRYTHRVALSSRRLRNCDPQAHTVSFAYKDYADHDRFKTMTLSWGEFLRRFCLHLLPERFVKIRHYGLLSNRFRHRAVEQARQLLAVAPTAADPLPAPMPEPTPPEASPLRCPYCGQPTLQLIEIVAPTLVVCFDDTS